MTRTATSIAAALAAMVAVAGCASAPRSAESAATAASPGEEAPGSWRATATAQDRARIRDWHGAWQDALADGRAKGFGLQIAAEGVLLQPEAALPNPHLPPGNYRCRTIKLGAQAGTLGYVAYDWFACRVDGEQGIVSLTKTSGSQRPVGLIFPDTMRRQIFLGTLVLGDETTPIDYGADKMRDMAGLVERIGARRWRLVLPRPAYESLLDVIELVPAE
ncbi:MAG: DUF4893 domain-containing protein [Sphingopyxis sp.]|nr:DUF4893 domain-containing protein [Sphingopyxis sp.]